MVTEKNLPVNDAIIEILKRYVLYRNYSPDILFTINTNIYLFLLKYFGKTKLKTFLQLLFDRIFILRQLHRILRGLGLRRHCRVRTDVIRQAVQHELRGSGSSLGYRCMTARLLTSHGLSVSRSKVADLDPEGLSMRRRHQLSRRIYSNKGPNYLVHLDGYDKLKRYGFPIHGAICGFSRRVLWLNVANTNNKPKVVASHFMEFVNEIKGVPRCVRMDKGTENVLIEDIQMAFRWDHSDSMAGRKSVIKGSSHSNQRIERWWRSNKQGGCQFWIDLFKDLEDSETVDYKTGVRQEDIDTVRFYCHVPFSFSCKEENSIFFHRCMNEFGRLPPITADGALELFMLLKNPLFTERRDA